MIYERSTSDRRRRPVSTHAHWECDCVPEIGPSHCHACGGQAGRPVPWSETIHAPVSPLVVDVVARAFPCDACKGAAGAVVAEFGPLVSTREQVADTLCRWMDSGHREPGESTCEACLAQADSLFAPDGPLADRAEVEREALRQAAQIAYSYGRKPAAVPMERIIADDIAHRIETRAAEIREGGTR